MHVDRMFCSKIHHKCLGGTQYPALGELTKYKCLVPAQNRLPNALAEEVEGGLNNLELGKQFRQLLLF